MKKRILIVILPLLLISCGESKQEKANLLIEKWICKNKPGAYFEQIKDMIPMEYLPNDQLILDSLIILRDSSMNYQKMSINEDVLNSTANSELGEHLKVLSETLTDLSVKLAEQIIEDLNYQIYDFSNVHKAKYEGEKGYKAKTTVKTGNIIEEITFYFNEPVDTIQKYNNLK